MNIVIQKFGGTSIRNPEGYQKSLIHIKKELKLNHKIVCVVSAMGRVGEPYATDTLKNLIKNHVSKKEQDRLISIGEVISSVVFTDFLVENGIKAISLSTKELGINTNNNFTNADIIKVNDLDILNKLCDYEVVVVPGFQGLTLESDVTTLGRGGSDTTAIALGITLNAKYVEIISDVPGVFTADPRIVPSATKIPKLNYDILLAMTKSGSKVLHYKGALMAYNHRIKMKFVDVNDFNSYTVVEDENVLVKNVSYKNDFIKYTLNEGIGLLDYVYRYNNDQYVHIDDEFIFDQYLKINNIEYTKSANYSKVTVIIYDMLKMEEYHFVETQNVNDKINELHEKFVIKG
ncbi:MAG: aspartate kinase [Haloplasmataceae bacterium]|jgi:aspartate kinase|nr:aspartate kinase [Haloplasmataceae bacterium]